MRGGERSLLRSAHEYGDVAPSPEAVADEGLGAFKGTLATAQTH